MNCKQPQGKAAPNPFCLQKTTSNYAHEYVLKRSSNGWKCRRPSLVDIGHINAKTFLWSKQQKRVFQRTMSWLIERSAHGCQLLRVDLTTAQPDNRRRIPRNRQELLRRIRQQLHYDHISVLCLTTSEGNGVAHMLLAWCGSRLFAIQQHWLSNTWREIHSAEVVFVRRMRSHSTDIRKIACYFAGNCRGRTKARFSCSRKYTTVAFGKAWNSLKRAVALPEVVARTKTGKPIYQYNYTIPMPQVIAAWEQLLRYGVTKLGTRYFKVVNQDVIEVFDFDIANKTKGGTTNE